MLRNSSASMSSRRAKAPRQQPIWLLSIDPAAAAGWCLFKDGKPRCWGEADGTTWRGLVTSMRPVRDAMFGDFSNGPSDGVLGTRECVIEDGFFQYGKMTFKGTLTLGRRRGLAQAAGEDAGIDKFTFIGPSTWQNGLGWTRGQDTKVWSKAYVESRWQLGEMTHDVADAVALGSYFIDNYQALA